MEKLSMGTYTGLSVLGGEVIFTLFVIYGIFLTGAAASLHLTLIELLPGVSGINFTSWVLGAITVAVLSAAAGSFIAWIHNSSEEA